MAIFWGDHKLKLVLGVISILYKSLFLGLVYRMPVDGDIYIFYLFFFFLGGGGGGPKRISFTSFLCVCVGGGGT